MYGGAGAEELRQMYGEEVPVAYMSPDFGTAKGYADGHAPEEAPMGPMVTCVMESWVEGDPETGAPRTYLRVKRGSSIIEGPYKPAAYRY